MPKKNDEDDNLKNGLETDLFDWEEWDEADIMCIQFYDLTLRRDIGKYKKGTKFPWGSIDFLSKTLELGTTDKTSDRFKLKLDIVEE